MPWLVRDGKVLATLEVATSLRDRTRGLLGRDGIDGAILLRPAKSVHTLRMRFSIDVVFCDRELRVLRVTTLPRNRLSRPVLKAHAVIESEAGTMARWGVRVGDQLEVRGLDDDGVVDVRDGGPAATAPSSPNGATPDAPRPDDLRRSDPAGHDAHGARQEPSPRPPADIVGDDGSH
jgi:uncharacterized membrane protein (UPF0127 family)